MSTWKRSSFPSLRCGRCDHVIAAGQPYLELRPAAVTRVLLRCRACADVAVPDILPAVQPRPPLQLPEWTPTFALVGELARTHPVRATTPALQARIDARLAQIRAATQHTREPGEEG